MVHVPLLDENACLPNISISPHHKRSDCRHKKDEIPSECSQADSCLNHTQSSSKLSVDLDFHDTNVLQLNDLYLLQRCQRNAWKSIGEVCETLARIIQEQYSNKVVRLARKQLQATDRWGNSALHLVCFHRPPVHVVSRLLLVANLVRCDDPFLQPNDRGETPLSIACRAGACYQVLQLLLSPSSRALLSRPHQPVFSADMEGDTPFSGLVYWHSVSCKATQHKRYYASLYMTENEVEENEEMYPRSLDTSHSNGLSRVDRSINDHFSSRGTPLYKRKEVVSECILDAPRDKDKDSARIFHELWENISLLFDASWKDSSDEASFLLRKSLGAGSNDASWLDHPIHAAAFVADALPTSFMDLLFRLHNEWVSQDNDDSVHPLDLAVAREQLPDSHAATIARRAHMIDRLVTMDPSSAQRWMPISQRFVFHQAVAAGLTWHIIGGGSGPLQTLFHQAPEILALRDSKTDLYPFQVAATVKSDPLLHLDTIYHLLRHAPQLLSIST